MREIIRKKTKLGMFWINDKGDITNLGTGTPRQLMLYYEMSQIEAGVKVGFNRGEHCWFTLKDRMITDTELGSSVFEGVWHLAYSKDYNDLLVWLGGKNG